MADVHPKLVMFFAALCDQIRTGTARLGRRLAILSALVVLAWFAPLFHAPFSVAIEPDEVSTLHTPPSSKDRQFTLYARQALVQDEELARFNVGVTVRSGVAHLWGTVPNGAMARRATERVRHVPGLIDVRSEIRIVPAEDDILPWPTPVKIEAGGYTLVPKLRLGTTAEEVPKQSLGTSAGNDGNRRAGPGILHFRSSNLDSFASTAAYRNGPSGPPAVMPSIPLPAGPKSHYQSLGQSEARTPHPAEPVGVKGSAGASPSRKENLPEMVLQIRQGNERFRLIQFEIRGGTVRLWNLATRGDDLFAMAQSVARLPGVDRVIVENARYPKQ